MRNTIGWYGALFIVALLTTGCPTEGSSTTPAATNPNLAPLITVTAEMGEAEKAIIFQLNQRRDIIWHGEQRAKLLTAWAILKSNKPITAASPAAVEEETE